MPQMADPFGWKARIGIAQRPRVEPCLVEKRGYIEPLRLQCLRDSIKPEGSAAVLMINLSRHRSHASHRHRYGCSGKSCAVIWNLAYESLVGSQSHNIGRKSHHAFRSNKSFASLYRELLIPTAKRSCHAIFVVIQGGLTAVWRDSHLSHTRAASATSFLRRDQLRKPAVLRHDLAGRSHRFYPELGCVKTRLDHTRRYSRFVLLGLFGSGLVGIGAISVSKGTRFLRRLRRSNRQIGEKRLRLMAQDRGIERTALMTLKLD